MTFSTFRQNSLLNWVFYAPVLVSSSTGLLVLQALVLLALELLAPVLQAMCYKHQRYSYNVSTSGTATVLLAQCIMVSDMRHGHNSTVFRVLFTKISTGQKKIAPTGWQGWHVFATLSCRETESMGKAKHGQEILITAGPTFGSQDSKNY